MSFNTSQKVGIISVADLIDVELLHQVEIGAFPTQMSLGHCFHALFFQTVHHVIERILVWQGCKRLQKKKKKREK